MEKLKLSVVLVLMTMAMFFCSCSLLSVSDTLTTYSDMTGEQKVLYFMDVYSAQYEDYLVVSSSTVLTEDTKALLREKKELLTKLYSGIKTYESIVILNTSSPSEQEEVVLKYINLLLYAEGGST